MHYWDPIVFPGVYGYFRGGPAPFNTGTHGPAHWHNYFGNTSLNPNGIADPTAPSTCKGFTGAFWTPNLLGYNAASPGGYPVQPSRITYTFREDPPPGLAYITKVGKWDCGPGTTPKTDTPHLCPRGTVSVVSTFRPVFRGRVRVDFQYMPQDFIALSVGGAPLTVRNADGTFTIVCREFGPPFCEDEHSWHVDILVP